MLRALFVLIVFVTLPIDVVVAEPGQKNLFGSVYYNGDKIGQVHLTMVKNENDEIEELRANASVSFLGMEVYGFNQNLKENWSSGELQKMSGKADDDGTIHEISLTRDATEYKAVYNTKDLTLPLDAYPTSPWHYEITDNTLLFNIVDFDLLKVKISKEADTVKIGEMDVKTEKFTFSGDWKATLWFDKNKDFVKGEYDISGRQVTVILD